MGQCSSTALRQSSAGSCSSREAPMNKLIFIHGFNYDPRTFGPNHPERHLYARWRQMLQRGWGTVGFTWFSNPGLWNAWRHGYLGCYKYTWVLAEQASDRLAGFHISNNEEHQPPYHRDQLLLTILCRMFYVHISSQYPIIPTSSKSSYSSSKLSLESNT